MFILWKKRQQQRRRRQQIHYLAKLSTFLESKSAHGGVIKTPKYIVFSVLLCAWFLCVPTSTACAACTWHGASSRKWFKSTMVLVPLFGAHHIVLMVMSIAAVTPLFELYWLYIDQLFTSFQVCGLFVNSSNNNKELHVLCGVITFQVN